MQFPSLAATATAGILLFNSTAFATEEICGACERNIAITGSFSHSTLPDNFKITGAFGRDTDFREEISGEQFTLSISGINTGAYTAELAFIEPLYTSQGERVFDVSIAGKTVADNLDLAAATGKVGTVYRITNAFEIAIATNLNFSFTARKGSAKFNTLDLRNAEGRVILSTSAGEFVNEADATARNIPKVEGPELWRDPSQPKEARIRDLLSRMSLVEKSKQMRHNAPSIPRIGLPAYNYWNECLHGVGRAGIATVFPQAIGLAATWDDALLHEVADTIATEARAKHNQYIAEHNGNSAQYFGLTFWTPNINIFRDPRWGRGQETYGEDPFLTSRLGVAFINGLQGNDPKYIKAMACAKHFAVHSGPEQDRHKFDAAPPERDFYDTYLPHFEAAVREAHVGAVMGAYNRVYGSPANASTLLLKDLLRDKWGFDGHVVSDCGAIRDIYAYHKTVPTAAEASARAVKAGCDLCCGGDYGVLWRAVNKGFISEEEIDVALGRLLEARLRLGMFDPPEHVPYAHIPITENDSPAHAALALRTARESMVLLKNDGILPLKRSKIKRIAVIGTNAASVQMLLGNYNGTPSRPITILDGIKQVAGPNIEVTYETGGPLAQRINDSSKPDFSRAIAAAKSADVVIYVGGLDATLEREEKKVEFEGFVGGDRTAIELPAPQSDLLKALHATGKPVVFVVCSGSAIAMPWAAKNLPAILQAWYPGQAGNAVADVLFGDANPAGRLPVTIYQSTADLPPFDDYSMHDRTYRYFRGKPLFAFGHGLSYTRFKYSNAKLDRPNLSANDTLTLTVNVKNTGSRDGDEVVQVYFRHPKNVPEQPRLTLCGFKRVPIARGETQPVELKIPAQQFRRWDTLKHDYVVDSGEYELLVGPASDKLPIQLKVAVR